MNRIAIIFICIWLGCLALLPVSPVYGGAGPDPSPTPVQEPALAPQQTDGIELTASVRGGGSYRIGTWLPVTVVVHNQRADMTASLRVSASRGGAQYGATLDLPNGARKSVTIYALISTFTRRLTVRLMAGDQQLAQQQLTVDPHSSSDRLIGLVAEQADSIRLPKELDDHSKLIGVSLAPRDLPERAVGLSSFDALLLDDVATNELGEGQRTALREWVARGGQLIISGGAGVERTLAGLPDDLRPVIVGALQTVSAASVLPGMPGGAQDVTLVEATPADSSTAVGRATSEQEEPPLLIERPLGRGVVSFATLALHEPALAAWPQATSFWSTMLQPRATLPPGFGPSDLSPDQMTEGNIASMLTRLPALNLPSLTQLGWLLLTYIILVGPMTFLVLRRLDRQALGWIVVPIITVVFVGAAYGLGYAQRGGDVVLNQISVVEPLDAHNARVRSFVGLFSPARRSYKLNLSGDVLVRPVSLQGPWDTSEQDGVFEGQSASALDVPQWSMRALVADGVQPFAELRAELQLDGDQLSGEVINGTGQQLRDVVVVQDIHVVHVGDMSPGERRTIAFTDTSEAASQNLRNKLGNTSLSMIIYHEQFEAMNAKGGMPLSPELQLRQGLLDSMYAAGPAQRNAAPLLIAWADTPPLNVSLSEQRVERQQLTMITLEPQLRVKPGQVTLDQGWLQRDLVIDDPTNTQAICMGSRGVGVNLFGQPVVQALTLPRALRDVRPSTVTLIPSADGAWPDNAALELYDWANATWVPQTFDSNTPLIIDQPASFLNTSTGQIRARLNGQVNPQGGGCVYLDASVKGEVP